MSSVSCLFVFSFFFCKIEYLYLVSDIYKSMYGNTKIYLSYNNILYKNIYIKVPLYVESYK